MIYTDNCCCCVELRWGCILIAIVDVMMRGLDKFIVDRDSLMGLTSYLISAIYLVCCIVLLIGSLMNIRMFLIPYILVCIVHVLIVMCECAYVIMVDDFYDFLVFDMIQVVLGIYFCMVVYSYYDSILYNAA